jgi:hypothetical protein
MKMSRGFRLMAMLAMTFSFFLVEIVFGYISHSVALVERTTGSEGEGEEEEGRLASVEDGMETKNTIDRAESKHLIGSHQDRAMALVFFTVFILEPLDSRSHHS